MAYPGLYLINRLQIYFFAIEPVVAAFQGYNYDKIPNKLCWLYTFLCCKVSDFSLLWSFVVQHKPFGWLVFSFVLFWFNHVTKLSMGFYLMYILLVWTDLTAVWSQITQWCNYICCLRTWTQQQMRFFKTLMYWLTSNKFWLLLHSVGLHTFLLMGILFLPSCRFKIYAPPLVYN